MRTWLRLMLLTGFLGWLVLGGQGSSFAAEINGIYTEAATKDVGKITGIKMLDGLKTRGWLSTYYQYNFNDPTTGQVQSGGCLGGPDANLLTPEYDCTPAPRAFDFRHNSLGPVELAEMELEMVPGVGEIGFKFDLAFGDTQSVISTTANELAAGGDGTNDPTKFVQHASVSYVAPIGRGLRIDFGKFVTHIGGETIAGIKNNYTFSHGMLYTHAILFQDYGLRLNYPLSDQVYVEYYLLNGWNVAQDNNKDKTHGFTVGYVPNPKFAFYANYLGGPENTNNNHDWRHLIDTQIYMNPFGPLNLWLFATYGSEEGPLVPVPDTSTTGGEFWVFDGVVWFNLTDRIIPAFRAEWMKDKYGTMTGSKGLNGLEHTALTFTLNYKLHLAGETHILIRPEYRYDRSTENVFSKDISGNKNFQNTLGINAVYYF